MFGNPETTTGGRALKFYSSVRLDIRRTNQIKEGEEVVGSRVKVKVVKNKCAAPFRQAEFDVGYGEGISKTGELIDIGIENKIIEKSGSWFSYGDVRLGQGRENAKLFIKENPDLSAEIEGQGPPRPRHRRPRADRHRRRRAAAAKPARVAAK